MNLAIMASIVKVLHIPRITKYGYCPVYQVVRNHWNKDYKPGPYPVTQKERDAAAKKYGLLPAEYEPYPDDGLGHGDYPKLPAISGDDKDPYYPWDFPEHKRNFNEPIHVHADMYGEDRYNVSFKPRFSRLYMWTSFLGVVGGFFAIYFFMEDKKMFRPVVPKQYYRPGVVHYTFEPAE
uniref:NADH dehydrogenase [ubiquinone] 1 beta subcomplex subunit 8, mitochondrial n=1 Tax=Timema tahoe TaxID=61484 RepID=A0A7R9IFF5_9NEOP|nr:unnamed protein product [Timema tahoe]